MKAQRMMQDLQRTRAKVVLKEAMLDEWNARATSVSVRLDPNKVQGSGKRKGLDDLVVSIADLCAELEVDIFELRKKEKSAMDVLDAMKNPMHMKVLYHRYFFNQSYEKIADEIGYSKRQIERFHGDALAALNRQLEDKK